MNNINSIKFSEYVIKEKDFNYWLESPITQVLLSKIELFKQASIQDANNYLWNIKKLKDLEPEYLAERRGFVLFCDNVLDTRTFLIENIEMEKEKNDRR